MMDYFFILLGYLFGSVASAVIVCKLMGLTDPRTAGSKNPGATNVLRLHGKSVAAVTLLGDVLKGVIPVLLARYWSDSNLVISLTGLAAFLGHLYPVFFGFKGGKGVATLLGVLFATDWTLGVSFVVIWLVMAKLFHYSSLSALTAAALIPFIAYSIEGILPIVFSTCVMAILLFWRHKSNIQNLRNGTEKKLGQK